MKFWKMQGCGNDFIVLDGRFDGRSEDSYSLDAEKYCSRKFSVGADGFIIVKDSNVADIQMVYYNADGSRGEMCGNGIRCFSKYIVENKIVNKAVFTVETLGGCKEIHLQSDVNGYVSSISVNMGNGNFEPELIPVQDIYKNKEKFMDETILVLGKEFRVSSMLMGVPHTVVFVEDELSVDELEKYGKEIENNPIFPNRTNVNFVKVIDKNNIFVQTWERGCGYTFGCGTGMTASAIIANYFGKASSKVNVSSPGGTVCIDITTNGAFMIGSAQKTFEGVI